MVKFQKINFVKGKVIHIILTKIVNSSFINSHNKYKSHNIYNNSHYNNLIIETMNIDNIKK